MTENKFLAKHLHKLGLNVTCITNYITEENFYDANILKGPYHKWHHLKDSRQTIEELTNYDWDNSVGLGTVAGFNSLHVLDIDGCSNFMFIEDLLKILGLPKYYEWVVRSGGLDGYHIYFYSDILEELEEDQVATTYCSNQENTALFDKMELLWSTHVVLPNSIHKSGSKYSFSNSKFPQSKPKQIDIARFKILEKLFLNIDGIEKKKVYFHSSKKKHKNLKIPGKGSFIDLSLVEGKKIFLFDIETDGLIENDTHIPNLIQISWVIMDTKGIAYKKSTELVNSNFNSNSKAFKINHISPSTIREIGRPPNDVYQDVLFDLRHCDIIVSHNLKFDLRILENEFLQNQVDFQFESIDKFCTMEFSISLVKNEINKDTKYLKLVELYEVLFNHNVKQFHNANSDVTILAKCVKELMYQGKLDHLNWY